MQDQRINSRTKKAEKVRIARLPGRKDACNLGLILKRFKRLQKRGRVDCPYGAFRS